MAVRVVVAEHDSALRNSIREAVGIAGYETVGLARDGHEAMQMCMQLTPDIALIAHDLPGIGGPGVCEMVSALQSSIMTVLMVDSRSPQIDDIAMRAGVRALLVKPIEQAKVENLISGLADAIAWRRSSEVTQWQDPQRYPKIITVTGAKGGVGKSTIAVNLAIILALELPGQVALLDMYTQFGDIATMLDLKPQRTIADIVQAGEDMDDDLVQSCAMKHVSGVHVYVTSEVPLALDAVGPDRLDSLLYILRRSYRYVVIDMPPVLTASTMHVMAHSNHVLLIANLFDLTTATDTKKLFDTLQTEMIAKENVNVVLNRVSKANRLHVGDLQTMFDSRVIAQIPNESRLVNSINQGTPPAMSEGASPLIASLGLLARQITGLETVQAQEKPSGFMGFLKVRQGA